MQSDNARVGIAGLDENLRLTQAQACLGIATDGDRQQRGAFGIAGLTHLGKCQAVDQARGCVGIAGNLNREMREDDGMACAAALCERDASLAGLAKNSTRLGDRVAQTGWRRTLFFSDYSYAATPYEETDKGGYRRRAEGGIGWRLGREKVFGREKRALPLYFDSAGYRREITGTAPGWTHEFETYPAAIELCEPDGYAWYDFPRDRAKTLEYGRRLMTFFPDDVTNGRQWPVFSIRWTWNEDAHWGASHLPGWRSRSLAALIPLTRTQRPFKRETRERWARLAIANAMLTAVDPDFRWMVETFGRVMLGGMVASKCPRMARHLYIATLCHLYPEAQFWGLGQASATVVNGLGSLGLLDRVYVDGSFWLLEAALDRISILEKGLITMLSLEGWAQSFMTFAEAAAMNIRALSGAYAGEIIFPKPEPLPTDMMDREQAEELKRRAGETAEEVWQLSLL